MRKGIFLMRIRAVALSAAALLFGQALPATAGCTFEPKLDLPITMRGTRPITPVKGSSVSTT